MQQIIYSHGGLEELDKIGFLWEKLMLHHKQTGSHPAIKNSAMTFEQRKQGLLHFAQPENLRVDLAGLPDGTPVGYCISSVDADKKGEIESFYVEIPYRQQGIGDRLMQSAIQWLDSKQVQSKVVSVVIGNEAAHTFYNRFGFYPKCTLMMQVK